MLVAVDEKLFLAVDIYSDVTTAAKKIKEAVNLLWKKRKYLREQLEYTSLKKLQHRLWHSRFGEYLHQKYEHLSGRRLCSPCCYKKIEYTWRRNVESDLQRRQWLWTCSNRFSDCSCPSCGQLRTQAFSANEQHFPTGGKWRNIGENYTAGQCKSSRLLFV